MTELIPKPRAPLKPGLTLIGIMKLKQQDQTRDTVISTVDKSQSVLSLRLNWSQSQKSEGTRGKMPTHEHR